MSMQLHHTLMSQYKHGTASGMGSVSYESVANCVTPEIVIYGKCVQDGTPTPDAPVDIVANNNVYKCHGKNLFDGNLLVGYFKNATGAILSSSDFEKKFRSLYMELPAGTYTLSFTGATVTLARVLKDGVLTTVSSNKLAYYTFESNGGYIGFSWYKDGLVDWDENTLVQVETGTVATPHEPYFNGGTIITPELYAVGDVRDEYYPQTGKIVRRCKKVELTSASNLTQYSTRMVWVYWNRTGVAGYKTSIWSHFNHQYANWADSYNGTYGTYSSHMDIGENTYLRQPNESVDTTEKFKAWLDEQKAKGTPVIGILQMAEPVIEYVEPVVLTSKRSIGKKIILDSSCDIRAYTYQGTKNGIVVYGLFPTDEVVYDALTCTHESSYKDDGTEYSFMFINANLKRLYWIGILDEMGMTRAQFISWLDEQKAAGTPVTVTYFPNGSFNTIEESRNNFDVLYGKCVQDGTPTPDAPVDIVGNNSTYTVFGNTTVTAPDLLSVGDVRDEYYPLTGKIIRRCKKHILSSADTITTYGTITFIYNGENPKTEQNTSICSHSKNVMSAWGADFNGVYGVHSDNNLNGFKYFRPPNDSIDTIDKFKAWLDEQKAAGTPVILVYQLAEPVIEYIEPVPCNMPGTQIDVKYLTHS